MRESLLIAVVLAVLSFVVSQTAHAQNATLPNEVVAAIRRHAAGAPGRTVSRLNVVGSRDLGDGRVMHVAVLTLGVPMRGEREIVFALSRGSDVRIAATPLAAQPTSADATSWPDAQVSVAWADFDHDGRLDPLVTVLVAGRRTHHFGFFSPPDPPADEYWAMVSPALVLATADADAPALASQAAHDLMSRGPVPLSVARGLIARAGVAARSRGAPRSAGFAIPSARAHTFEFMENPGHAARSVDVVAVDAEVRALVAERVLGLRCDRRAPVCFGNHASEPSPTYWTFVRVGRTWRISSMHFYVGE